MKVTGEDENALELKPRESAGHPRVDQCYICRVWQLEKSLFPIEVPDQAGWIEKKACQKCLDQILKGEGSKDEGSKTV